MKPTAETPHLVLELLKRGGEPTQSEIVDALRDQGHHVMRHNVKGACKYHTAAGRIERIEDGPLIRYRYVGIQRKYELLRRMYTSRPYASLAKYEVVPWRRAWAAQVVIDEGWVSLSVFDERMKALGETNVRGKGLWKDVVREMVEDGYVDQYAMASNQIGYFPRGQKPERLQMAMAAHAIDIMQEIGRPIGLRELCRMLKESGRKDKVITPKALRRGIERNVDAGLAHWVAQEDDDDLYAYGPGEGRPEQIVTNELRNRDKYVYDIEDGEAAKYMNIYQAATEEETQAIDAAAVRCKQYRDRTGPWSVRGCRALPIKPIEDLFRRNRDDQRECQLYGVALWLSWGLSSEEEAA